MRNYQHALSIRPISLVRSLPLLLLLVVPAFTLFYGLDHYGVMDNNEGLYAEIPREMVETGDFVVPRLNYVPYIEKPPLLYWLIAASYKMLGVSEYSSRVVIALSALAVCIGTLFFSIKLGIPRTGALAALIMASSLGYIALSRTVMFDMLLTCCMTFSLFFFYLWYEDGKKNYIRLYYAFLGFAVLTKGFASLVIVPFILFISLAANGMKRRSLVESGFFDPGGILLFFLIAAPWHIAAMIEDKNFAWFYFINEHVLRFLGLRHPHDFRTGPLYYYLPRILLFMFPWSVFVPLLFRKGGPVHGPEKNLKRFLFIWFFALFAFFSISEAKAEYYLITAVPPLSMLLAVKLEENIVSGKTMLIKYGTGSLFILGFVAPILVFHIGNAEGFTYSTFTSDTVVAFGLFSFSCFVSLMMLRTNRPFPALNALAVAMIPLIILGVKIKNVSDEDISCREMGKYISSYSENTPVYLYKDFEELSSLVFYVKREVPVIESVSRDLDYGKKTARGSRLFVSKQEFKKSTAGGDFNCLVVVRDSRVNDFLAAFDPRRFHIVKQAGDAVLFRLVR